MDKTKIINILDPQSERIEETVVERTSPNMQLILEANGRTLTLKEAAEITTTDFPQLLRTGLRGIMYSEYGAYPSTHTAWIGTESSNKEYETGIEANKLGKAPIRPEGKPYDEAIFKLDRSVQIQNQDRGYILPITWQMMTYDRVGMIRDAVADLANSMAYTEEDDAYTIMTTATNYTRTVAGGDNDVGNNTGTTTFSAGGLETALSTLRTMKDRDSGRYFGIMPDTLVVGVGVEMAAKQLLTSSTVSGMGDTDAVLTYGTGTTNPWRGLVNQIIVTPFLGRYEWCLLQRGKPIRKFVVDDLELLEENRGANSTAYFERRAIRYRMSKIYGVGMWNDRFAYFSDSTTAPTVT